MWQILKLIKGKNLKLLIATAFLTLLQTFSDVLQPFLLMSLTSIDVNTGSFLNNTPEKIFAVAGIMIGLTLFGLVTGGASIMTTSRLGSEFGGLIRLNTFKKIQSFSFSDVDHFTTASLITRLTNDVVFIQNTSILTFRLVFRAAFLFFGGVILSFVLSPALASIFLGFCLFLIILLVIVILKATPHFKRQKLELDKLNSTSRENILGARVVKAFNMQESQVEKFQDRNKVLKTTWLTAQNITSYIMPSVLFIVQSSTIVIIMSTALNPSFVDQGSGPQVSTILSFTQIISLIVIGLVSMLFVLGDISSVKSSADRIAEILNWKVKISKSLSDKKIENSSFEYRNVSFSYSASKGVQDEKDEYALRDISFKIEQGESLGIIGKTGSGKSTLINLLAKMYDVSKGSILISGIDIREIDNTSLRKSISVSPQKTVLFAGTIRSNLMFGNTKADENDLKIAAIDAQALDFIEKKDLAFDAEVEQRGNNFSGGQKQRLSIARALIRKPKILILDDSTSALDLITEAKLQTALKKYKETTVVFIATRISSISRADKILVLDDGKMCGFGTHSELIKKCPEYKEIAKSQEML